MKQLIITLFISLFIFSCDHVDKKEPLVLQVSPALKVSLDTISFNGLKINESKEIDLVISNTGTSALKFIKYDEEDNILATNADAISFGSGTSNSFELVDLSNVRTLEAVKIENNEEVFDSFTIKVKYTAKSAGIDSGTLIISNNSTNASPQKIINVTASSGLCNLVIQPQDGYIDFGERPQGSDNIFIILLANTGDLKCTVNKIELDTDNSSPEFTIKLEENTNFPFEILPTERYQFKVLFKPTETTEFNGVSGVINLESDDQHWSNGEKKITLYGKSKENNSPVCIIKNLSGGEPYFSVEPGERENVECTEDGVCSNVQMISESYDPNPNNSGDLIHTWRMIESPAAYGNTDWITFPSEDPSDVSNSDKHYVDFYVPYATPSGTKYLVELTVTSISNSASSNCYAEIYGLTGNSLHVELFWNTPSNVDLHLMNPTDQSLNINDISTENPSLDPELEAWRSITNAEWWDTGKDCHWSNCKGSGIEWGVPGSVDNPILSKDDLLGYGPENININQPQEGWYRVLVHQDSPTSNGTNAHVRIYCNGTVAYENNAFLAETNYTWLVNDIYWEDLGNNDGQCYVFSDGRIFSDKQGEGSSGYQGTLIEDIEPDIEN